MEEDRGGGLAQRSALVGTGLYPYILNGSADDLLLQRCYALLQSHTKNEKSCRASFNNSFILQTSSICDPFTFSPLSE